MLAAAWITAVATGLLAVLAAVTALYARRAFREQSREVRAIERQVKDQQELTRQQAELLKVQAGQLEIQSGQLDLQRQQVDDQRKINNLLADDLRGSVEERARLRQSAEREQADKIGFLMGSVPFPNLPDEDPEDFAVAPGEQVHMAIVSNESGRPIKNVVCKRGNGNRDEDLDEDLFGPSFHSGLAVVVGRYVNPRLRREGGPILVEAIPASRAFRIRPEEAYGFVFDVKVHRVSFANELVRFTDDAGLHWQIDRDLHLEPLAERDW